MLSSRCNWMQKETKSKETGNFLLDFINNTQSQHLNAGFSCNQNGTSTAEDRKEQHNTSDESQNLRNHNTLEADGIFGSSDVIQLDFGDSLNTVMNSNLNLKDSLKAFFDDLYTELINRFEGTINESLNSLNSGKPLKKPIKEAISNLLLAADLVDELINEDLNKVEKELNREIDMVGPLESEGYDSLSARLTKHLNPDKMLMRIEVVRNAIRDQLETMQEVRKKRIIEQFENSYRRQFTESLPSLKFPAKKLSTEQGAFECKLTMACMQTKQSSHYSDGRIKLDNIDSFTERIKKEIGQVNLMMGLYKELKIHCEKNRGFFESLSK